MGRLARLTGAIALLLLPREASAEMPTRDPAAAEALFAQGQVWMQAGDYARACPALEESYRLDPATGALFAVALCHEQQGRLASAWVEFMDVASRANAERYPERERAAREHAEALKARLSFLTVHVDPRNATLRGFVVARDGIALGPAAWGTPIPVDPGSHIVVATAPGHQPWTTSVTVGEKRPKEAVAVPKLSALAVTAAVPARAAPEPAPLRMLGVPMTPLRVAGVSLGTAGVVSLGLAGFSMVRAVRKNADSERACSSGCTEQGKRDRLSAFEAAELATVSGIAAGVLLSAGVTLFIVGTPPRRTSLLLSPGAASLQAVF